MSDLQGLFSLKTSRDLPGKLEHDFKRLRTADPATADAHYAAFDFFVAAEHLLDWISRSIGGSLSSHRAYSQGPLVSHMANGAEHFRVDTTKHTTARTASRTSRRMISETPTTAWAGPTATTSRSNPVKCVHFQSTIPTS